MKLHILNPHAGQQRDLRDTGEREYDVQIRKYHPFLASYTQWEWEVRDAHGKLARSGRTNFLWSARRAALRWIRKGDKPAKPDRTHFRVRVTP